MNWLKLFLVALFLCCYSFRAEAQTAPAKDQILRIEASPIDKVEKDAKPKPAKAGKTILFYEQQ